MNATLNGRAHARTVDGEMGTGMEAIAESWRQLPLKHYFYYIIQYIVNCNCILTRLATFFFSVFKACVGLWNWEVNIPDKMSVSAQTSTVNLKAHQNKVSPSTIVKKEKVTSVKKQRKRRGSVGSSINLGGDRVSENLKPGSSQTGVKIQ